jgi:selenocysteine-specific elongation factor
MFAQLLLNAPLQAVHGDRLVLRDQRAQRTLAAAGCSTRSPRAGNAAVRCVCASCRCCDAIELEQALPALLATARGLDPQRLERQFNRRRETWQLPDHVVVIATRQGQLLFARSNGRHSSNSCWRAWRVPRAGARPARPRP